MSAKVLSETKKAKDFIRGEQAKVQQKLAETEDKREHVKRRIESINTELEAIDPVAKSSDHLEGRLKELQAKALTQKGTNAQLRDFVAEDLTDTYQLEYLQKLWEDMKDSEKLDYLDYETENVEEEEALLVNERLRLGKEAEGHLTCQKDCLAAMDTITKARGLMPTLKSKSDKPTLQAIALLLESKRDDGLHLITSDNVQSFMDFLTVGEKIADLGTF